MNPRSDYLISVLEISKDFGTETSIAASTTEYVASASMDRQRLVGPPIALAQVKTSTASVTPSLELEHSDDNSAWAVVAAGEYTAGAAPAALVAGGTGVLRAAYAGTKRYVRARLKLVNSSSNAQTVAVVVNVLGTRAVGAR